MSFPRVGKYLIRVLRNPSTVRHIGSSTHPPAINPSRIGIVGATSWKGQAIRGVDLGPKAMRNHGIVKYLQNIGLEVQDYGDIHFLEDKQELASARNCLTVGNACKEVSNMVSHVMEEGRLCVTLGGDHSLGIGTLYGHSRVYPDFCCLWIDAHADINTPAASPTGNIHGMPLSFVINEMEDKTVPVPGFHWIHQRCLPKDRLSYIGLRDVDSFERMVLETLGISYYSMQDVDRFGIYGVVERALRDINPKNDRSLHVSFDIDALDKTISPSTGTPVLGGLTMREAMVIGEEVFRTGCLHGLDLMEVNPTMGTEKDIHTTLESAFLVIGSFLGKDRRGSLPVHQNPPLKRHAAAASQHPMNLPTIQEHSLG